MKVLELFAGAGGAALGLEAAGLEHAALCEWNADACATLRAAGLGPVVEGDVRDLDAIESVAGAGPLDLLWSSFPCQAWSQAGDRRGAEDDRNGWPWTVDAIDRFRPRWFLAENVRGLIQHSEDGHPNPAHCPRCYFERVILAQLRERFACVGWWLLDAADYGVPQHRRRVIIWAGPAPLRAPRPTHGAPSKARQRDMFGPGVLPWVSMGEALGLGSARAMLPNRKPPIDCTDRPSPTIDNHAGQTGEKYEQALRITTLGLGGAKVIRGDRNPQRAGPWVLHHMRNTEAHPNQERPTLSTEPSPTVGGAGNQCAEGQTFRRRLTVEECATLQAFPSGHPWQGSKSSRYRQVGNAVPPLLAQAVVSVLP